MFALLAVSTVPPRAAIRPGFEPCESAWRASDVVVVTEGDAIDGRFDVLEVWRGTLEPGAEVEFPVLAAFADAEKRLVRSLERRPDRERADLVSTVTGARMVLFLARDDAGELVLADSWAVEGEQSVAWIEGGRVFARRQLENPGPSVVTDFGTTEAELRTTDERLAALRRAFDRMSTFEDPLERALAMRAMCREPFDFVRERAFDELVRVGPTGEAVLRDMVLDAADRTLLPYSVGALARAAGDRAPVVLTELLGAEIDFWASVPLPVDWYATTAPVHPTVRSARTEHLPRLVEILVHLRRGGDSTRDVVREVRRIFTTRAPLVAVPDDELQVVRLCDAFLAEFGG
ncbi:MAG: hypothetical protein R3F34_15755 [Planctomycetota bacterium]